MIGKVLKKMRKDKKFKQEEISSLVNIGRTTLSDYEREKTAINFDLIEKIAECCDYEVIFKNKITGESFSAGELERKDL